MNNIINDPLAFTVFAILIETIAISVFNNLQFDLALGFYLIIFKIDINTKYLNKEWQLVLE